jgi:peptide/nickel transport system substrate-binding protein
MRAARCLSAMLALALAFPGPAASAQAAPGGTIVIVTGEQATVPVPTLMEGRAARTANFDVADQLFLRLAINEPGRPVLGDAGFVPQLARSWERRDSLTLVFELDPRARWHDGTPVTARDVVFTFGRALDPQLAPSLAGLLRHLATVSAEGEQRVVFRFHRAYTGQFFDATYYVQPIPAHLVGSIPADSLGAAPFVRAPVGNGPYRWMRSVPGQYIELAANEQFFLGRPGTARLVFRTATDADARMNLLLSGEGDAMVNVIPPLGNRDRLARRGEMRLIATQSNGIGYLLFNARAAGDSSRPHPLLGDERVRRALIAALDREAMVRSTFGPYAKVPYGPVSGLLWVSALAPRAQRQNVGSARALLAAAGWRDSDGDGTLDRAGQPFRLSVIVPSSSAVRKQLAVQAQEQLSRVGIRLDVLLLEGPVWGERHSRGNFDISFGSATQDPTPAGLAYSWSCTGTGNVGRHCNPAADSLMARAVLSSDDPSGLWLDALRRIEGDARAAYLFAPMNLVAVHRRFEQVEVRPDSPWMMAYKWKVRRGRALDRDAAAR